MAGIIALIPAKGFSRRLPAKNVKKLGGIPLFIHSVKVALESGVFDEVVVSSDSEEILNLAREYDGIVALKRPTVLCGDDVPNFEVCKHVIETLKNRGRLVEQIALLQPTQPFRTVKGLKNAIYNLSLQPEFDSLASVTKIHRLTGDVVGNQWVSHSKQLGERAQAKKDMFEMTGHLFLLRVQHTINLNSLLGKLILAWPLPGDWVNVDIDNPFDFMQAEGIVAHGFLSDS